MKPTPYIAFKRLCRLYGGITMAVVASHLVGVSAWFALLGLAGVGLMVTTIIPMFRETRRDLDESERRARDYPPPTRTDPRF